MAHLLTLTRKVTLKYWSFFLVLFNILIYLIDFDLTPNRGDCFSIRGLARDYCAFKGKNFSLVKKASFKGRTKFRKSTKDFWLF